MLNRSLAIAAIVLPLASASCAGGGSSASECRAAAETQALAEDAYVAAITAHEEAHAAGSDDHPDTDDHTFTRRVDMIVATEATRRACQ